MSIIDTSREALIGLRLIRSLPGFLASRIGPAQARAVITARLRDRQANFLAMVDSLLQAPPANPMRLLLEHAGCRREDLAKLVRREGVEGALLELFDKGVYLTVDEFKGVAPVVRGSLNLAASPGPLRNTGGDFYLKARTSGSRGKNTPVLLDLEYIYDCAVDSAWWFKDRNPANWLHAQWGVPGGSGLMWAVEFTLLGMPPQKWFSQIDPESKTLSPRYKRSSQALKLGAALGRTKLPKPQHAPLHDPAPVLEWLSRVLAQGKTPHIITMVSSAVRLCREAGKLGLDLSGAQFTVGGEPINRRRAETVQNTGARIRARYAAMEFGPMGLACHEGHAPDEVHLLTDRLAAIQPGPAGPAKGLPENALLMTPLLPTAPFSVLNLSVGDSAFMYHKPCGCPMHEAGFDTHLEGIGNYEKITAGGMTFLASQLAEALDQALPEVFGGGPTDYQLLEECLPSGESRLTLLLSPEIEVNDEARVLHVFLEALAAGDGPQRMGGEIWTDAGFLELRREHPSPSAEGKITHLITSRRLRHP